MAKRKKRNRGGGVPFNPDVDTGTKRPVTARVAVGDVNDKFSDYPSNGLTPRRLARIFREADEGNVRAQMELFEEMEEKDTHLFSQMQTRKLAVTGLDWEVQPFSEDEIDKEIADFIDEQLKGIENFDEVLIDMLDAIGKGISIMELAWTVEDGRNVIEDIEYVHPKKLVWDSTTDELKVCTREYPSGVELPENKFVVHKYKAKSGHASRAGIMRVVSWMYLFKNYDIKDWVSFCEVFGMPLRLVFKEAVAFLKGKRTLTSEEYKMLSDESRAKAFTVSGYTSLEVLQEFLDCLTKAAEEGTTKEQFLEDMNRFLEEHGYEGINPWKCDNIFRTNMQTALNAGHYKSMTDETTMKLRPYWRYRTAGDGHVRESHAVMEGRVYRADDPIWDVWYPPNGFRCRCMVVSLSKKQVERMGLHVETEAPYDVDYSTGEILTKFPDKGFSNNPAKTVWKPDMTNISPELRKMFRERKQPEDGETK